jgi:glycosyltransferase involved in cell wall biosynthesis
MRALFLSDGTTWEGGVRVFAAVARALAERGHETWLAAPAGSEAATQAVDRGVRVIALPGRRGLWSDSRRLRQELPRDFVDAVFVHSEREQLTATWAVRAARRGSIVRRIAAGERLVAGWRTRRAEQVVPVRYLYTSESPPTGHAAPSGSLSPMRAELGVELGTPTPTGRASNGLGGAAPAAVLVYLATRASLRRATNVVRAAAMLAQRHADLRLRVIGSVAADEELKLLAAALGIAKRVEWIGHPRDLALALHGASAGWVIADGDDAGLGALELMAHGIAVLAERTSIAGRYVNHGIQGTLMATLDPPLMAAETAILLSDRDRRVAMGAAGRARVEREFSQREMLASFELAMRASRERMGAGEAP